MARPKKVIDETQVIELAKLGCTQEEIACVLQCSVDTLDRRFAETMKRGMAELKVSLRRMQVKSAEGGNVTAQIWLGKNLLGQSEYGSGTGDAKEATLRGVAAALVSIAGAGRATPGDNEVQD